MVGWLVGWLFGRMVGWMDGWLGGWLGGLVGWEDGIMSPSLELENASNISIQSPLWHTRVINLSGSVTLGKKAPIFVLVIFNPNPTGGYQASLKSVIA